MLRGHRSPLTAALREAHRANLEADARGWPLDEITELRAHRRAAPRRRELLGGGLAASALAMARRSRAAPAPGAKVVIVGAGLAGLNCARLLWTRRGWASTIYEASEEIGGRVRSLRGYFANDEVAELHGEFISSEHRRMRSLAALYGLALANVNAGVHDSADTAWFDGARYSQRALNEAWRDGVYDLFRDAVARAPGANYRHASPTARAWDQMSVTEWVERHVPGGAGSQLGGLCLADVISEYGGPPDEQSALNLIYILGLNASSASGYQSPGHPLLAGTNERWIVRGGNDQIVAGLAGELPGGSIELDHRLLAVRPAGSGFIATFQRGGAAVDVAADHLVLAIPPTMLRQVDLARVPLSPVKRRQIAELRLGTNAKIFIQVGGNPWKAAGWSGSQLTDERVCGGWDASCWQAGARGVDAASIYAVFPGGAPGAALAGRYRLSRDDGPAPDAMVVDALAEVEPILPGISAGWAAGPRRAYYRDGNLDPNLLGAYSYYRVGQYTGFSGVEMLPAGNLHFAGEHTSIEFQGYMEGALQSGERAAGEIMG